MTSQASLRSTLLSAMLATLSASPAFADEGNPLSLYAAVDVGRHQVVTTWPLFDEQKATATGTSSGMVGLRLGGELEQLPWLRAELGVAVLPFESTRNQSNTALLYSADVIYVAHALTSELLDTKLTPVADAGLGSYHNLRGDLGRDADLEAHIGVGLRGQLSDRFGLRVSIRDYFTDYIAGEGPGNNIEVSIGVEMMVFGPRRPYTIKKKVELAMVADTTDTDADTIIDAYDRCPTEPEDHDGFQDTDGCPEEDSSAWRRRRMPTGFQGTGDQVALKAPPPVEPPRALFKTVGGETSFAACYAGKNGVVTCPGTPTIDHIAIYFETDTTAYTGESLVPLRQIARMLTSFTEVDHVWIEGHADDRKSTDYNRALSLKRAQEVREYLIKAGVSAKRLSAAGFAAEHPVTTSKTEEAQALNKRVEFRIAPKSDKRGVTSLD